MRQFRWIEKFSPRKSSGSEVGAEVPAQIQEAVSLLKSARTVAVLSGAGISVESGLATFRAKVGGIWQQFDASEVATPSAFKRNPGKVLEWHQSMRENCRMAEPNAGHAALAALQDLFPEVFVVTQNIDGLHQRAGSQYVLEVHGNIFRMKGFCDPDQHSEEKKLQHCPVCRGCTAPPEQWNPAQRQAIVEFTEAKDGVMPTCPHCGGPLRHDIVWFDEPLDPYVLDAAWRIADECDVMLVIGASLQVQPMAGLPWRAAYRGAKVIEINPHPAESSGYWALRIQEPATVAVPQLVSALSVALTR